MAAVTDSTFVVNLAQGGSGDRSGSGFSLLGRGAGGLGGTGGKGGSAFGGGIFNDGVSILPVNLGSTATLTVTGGTVNGNRATGGTAGAGGSGGLGVGGGLSHGWRHRVPRHVDQHP